MVQDGSTYSQRGRKTPRYMTEQGINFPRLPYETEKILAETIRRIRKVGYSLENDNLFEILNRIADEMKISSRVRNVLSSERWLEGFKNRWGHKLCLEKRESAYRSANHRASHQDGAEHIQLCKSSNVRSSQNYEPYVDLTKSPMVCTDHLYKCSTSNKLNTHEPFVSLRKLSHVAGKTFSVCL